MSREETWATRTILRDDGVTERRVRTFRLQVQGGPRYELGRGRVLVGSRPGIDVTLADEAVSRVHFEIRAEGEAFRLRDLESRNGTFVDGYRVRDLDLRHGSTIRVGRTQLRFELTDRAQEVPLHSEDRFGDAVGGAVAMREIFATLARGAPTDVTVLLLGESGTGKEVIARSVHRVSRRAEGPFVVVDCGAIPPNLLESELFGHEKGAFTGAHEQRLGLLEEAQGGTLFLDEIGELPMEMQPKLLRALESRSVRRLGGRATIDLDVRLVAATNRDLLKEVNRGGFREDLYYRVAVLEVRVPALRERREDIPKLVAEFVRAAHRDAPATAERLLASITEANWDQLMRHPWPGNVRQLRNVVERTLALRGERQTLELEAGAASETSPTEVDLTRPYSEHKQDWVAAFEKAYVLGQLARAGGNISQAARESGLERMHFKRILKKHQ